MYDDHFTTVGSDTTQDDLPVPDGFDELIRFSHENALDRDDLEPTEPDHTELSREEDTTGPETPQTNNLSANRELTPSVNRGGGQ